MWLQILERLGGGLSLGRERPSLASSAWKKFCSRTPALASLVCRGLYCRQLENIRSTSSMYWPEVLYSQLLTFSLMVLRAMGLWITS